MALSRTHRIALVSIAIIIAIFFVGSRTPNSEKVVFTRINDSSGTLVLNNKTYSVTIADTEEERAQGLSGVASLKPDEGMLFMFPEAGYYGFWMKDMHFPLDFMWIDSSCHVVGITKNVPPSSYPSSFYPPRPVQYVLEIPSS